MALLGQAAGADHDGLQFDRLGGPGSRNQGQADRPGQGMTLQFHVTLQTVAVAFRGNRRRLCAGIR